MNIIILNIQKDGFKCMNNFKDILKINGLDFIKALIDFEQRRADHNFLSGSTYEQINADFGIFPPVKLYPTYFSGNIKKPKNKIIFVGINPGYSVELNKRELKYLQEKGCFEGYCHIFTDFFKKYKKGLLPYFANIKGFLRRYYNIEENIDWDWLQENLISLDLIPYHSENSSGLRINDIKKFRDVYIAIFLKILDSLNPQKPIFINGFPTFKQYFDKKELRDIVSYKEVDNFWIGKIGKFEFIGLPFLTQVRGGKDKLVSSIKKKVG